MSSGAINYFYDDLGLPSDFWQVYFSFNSPLVTHGGSTYIPSDYASIGSSGILSTGNPLEVSSGTGIFNGNGYISIPNVTGNLNNWTMMFHFSNSGLKEGVIFSNLSNGYVFSGFTVGVNAGNRLYVESYDQNGPFIYTSNIILGAANVVAVSKAGNGIFFDCLNANTKLLVSDNVSISQLSFLNSANWTVGGYNPSVAPEYYTANNFVGTMTDFLLLNACIRPDEIRQLLQGYYSYMSGGNPIVDENIISSLGMTAISYFGSIDYSNDQMGLYLSKVDNKFNTNNFASFNRVYNDFYASYNITGSGILSYANGLFMFGSSGFSIGGTYYNPSYTLTGDFVPSGSLFFSNGLYDNNDVLIYDYVGSNYYTAVSFYPNFSQNGLSTNITVSGNVTVNNTLVFFNGMRLAYNHDYTIPSSNTINFGSGVSLYDGATGLLAVAKLDGQFIYTGDQSYSSTQYIPFSRGTSLFWFNGVRQYLGINYVETSQLDYLYGVSQLPDQTEMIFFDDFNYFTYLNS